MIIMLIILFFLNTSPVHADMTTILGPVYISKDHHSTYVKRSVLSFTAPVPGTGVIVVKNGGDSGKNHRVGSARIILNGEEVSGPEDFNKNVEELRYDITLKADNALGVEVRSCRDCEIAISVLGPGTFPERPAI